MYGDTALIQQTIVQSGFGQLKSPRQAAAQLFWKTHLRACARRIWRLLTGRQTHLPNLEEGMAETAVGNRRFLGVQTVALNQIAGSEGRSRDFDTAYQPLQTHTQERWIGIAAAILRGVTLPPVELLQIGSRYFVRDGNHRVSVAISLGQTEIDAVVTRWA